MARAPLKSPVPLVDGQQDPLALDHFVPYRVSVLSNIISRSVAQLYASQFELTIPEWRVMVVLGQEEAIGETMCANSVAMRTAMDKVQVSRAVSRMLQAGLIDRAIDRDDRRRSVLRLTEKGHQVYAEIVPAALKYEAELLATLSDEQRDSLNNLISVLTTAARDLESAVLGRRARAVVRDEE
ncbi:MarR family winged helix-turn-helix transcriptional regulator [Insolitispirillum peregrinum]|uniref:DNA-binding transcriptional regulator, MarR family n=1 Tax=Insolitispirillum peregrinum TaxID=80876 RepID=A0A1N7IL16_9PROT|nr:MarR family winged helix-turn-helix transcriptional regulator [Insolitispirillum peregrinum]SIS37775.1 DNA-binding transcriptional regulator, MarR family [Insolitispirillum peregrinum]